MNSSKSVITLTFGDQAENHVGMEKLGKLVDPGQGFQLSDFQSILQHFESLHAHTDLYDLASLSSDKKEDEKKPEAYLLVIRNGVNIMLRDLGLDENEYNDKQMFEEQASLNVDKKVFMYGRVVNKHARWNLCFDQHSREPDYENGKGRIIAFDDVPITSKLIESFPTYFGEKTEDLKGEGNYYFDKRQCGIGFHGDSERRKVLAVRLGSSLNIHYQWFKEGSPVGKRIIVPLNGGDIYLMSEKAVGTDWKRKKVYTLRHATGCDKYTTIKSK
jgi:hypothetical protein